MSLVTKHPPLKLLRLPGELPKYQYTFSSTGSWYGTYTLSIDDHNEESAREKFFDYLEEEIREDETISLYDLSRELDSAIERTKTIEIKEILYIDPRQMNLPFPVEESNSKEVNHV